MLSTARCRAGYALALSSPWRVLPLLLAFGLLLAAVASLPLPGGAAQVAAGCLLLVGVVAAWRGPTRESRFALWAAGICAMLHFAVALYAVPIVRAHYAATGDDITVYHSRAKEIADALLANPGAVTQSLAEIVQGSTAAFMQLWGLLYLLTGGSYLAVLMTFAWLGTMGSLWFATAFETYLPDRQWRWYVLLTMFLPSILYWVSLPLKDTVTFSAFGLITYGLSRLTVGRLWIGSASIVTGGAACLGIRPYFVFFYGVPMLPALSVSFAHALRNRLLGRCPVLLAVMGVTGIFLWYVVSRGFFIGVELAPQGLTWLERYQDASRSGSSALQAPFQPAVEVPSPIRQSAAAGQTSGGPAISTVPTASAPTLEIPRPVAAPAAAGQTSGGPAISTVPTASAPTLEIPRPVAAPAAAPAPRSAATPSFPAPVVAAVRLIATRAYYLFAVLFRPMPWEANNWLALLTSIENVGLLAITIGILWTIKPVWRFLLSSPLVVFSALLAVLFTAVFSLQLVNLGTMARVKVAVLPFLLLFTCFGVERSWSALLRRSGFLRRLTLGRHE